MKNVFRCLGILFLNIYFLQGFAQTTYKITSHQATPEAFRYLLLSNSAIEDNDTINEKILDLVNPMVLDSVLGRKKEHHELFLVGWLIHAFGDFNWRAISMTKTKFVGTVRSTARSGAVEYSEYDINYDLNFHLPKYLNKAFYCYDCQRRIGRQDVRGKHHRTNYNASPFVRDTNNIDITRYRLHCELTPPGCFRPQLNYLFYPTLPEGPALKDHPNFGTDHPSMGFYGADCLDCNHNCHPELHPYEWAWWMNLHTGDEKAKTWLIGLFYESSNRFRHWSHNPKTGKTTIPFAFDLSSESSKHPEIYIEHLVFNRFVDTAMVHLNLPDTLFDAHKLSYPIRIADEGGKNFTVNIQFNDVLLTNGLKYWFSDLNWDENKKVLSGYLNFGVSAVDLYTTRITFRN